jgi:hypothetical protein
LHYSIKAVTIMKKIYCTKCKTDLQKSNINSGSKSRTENYGKISPLKKLKINNKFKSNNIKCPVCLNDKNTKINKLFLDDVRTIEMIYGESFEYEFDIVRTYVEFTQYIKKNGIPSYISFDNDLGLGDNGEIAPDGLAAAKWLVYYSGLDLKDLKFHVHSANPVASEQIRGLLNNYIKYLKSDELNILNFSNKNSKKDSLNDR